MPSNNHSATVTFVPEAKIGDMVEAGPWPPEMVQVMVSCLLRHPPAAGFVERRKTPSPATVKFTPTDITFLKNDLQLSLVIGEENPANPFTRRHKSYWIFGRLDRTSEFCPISQHNSMTTAVRVMVELYKGLLALSAKED